MTVKYAYILTIGSSNIFFETMQQINNNNVNANSKI